jgi:anti-sigma-K factor RskA
MYVCGSLPENEASEIQDAINTYPEVKREVEEIEKSLLLLAETVAPTVQAITWTKILNTISKNKNKDTKLRTLNLPAITGWAAAILFMG